MQEKQYIQEDEIDLRDLFKTIWDKRKFIVAFTFVVTLLAIIYAMSKTPVYEVKSVVRIGYTNDKLVEDPKVLEKKLRLIFNVDNKEAKLTKSNARVVGINTIKKVENFLEITIQGLNNESAVAKNKEVIKFLQDEYQNQIDDYILSTKQNIKNLEEKITYINNVDKVNIENKIEKIKTETIPQIDNRIKFIKDIELTSVENKLDFNKKKLKEYENNLITISKQKSVNNTENMLMAMQVLNTQNLILNLQNTIEDLYQSKENLLNIKLKNLELEKQNLIDENIRSLEIKLNIDIKNQIKSIQDNIISLKRKLSNNNVQNSKVVGQIQVSDSPIKPKKKLIVVVAFVTGFILSIFLVFFMQFIASFKNENKEGNI